MPPKSQIFNAVFFDKNLPERINKIVEEKVCTDVDFVFDDGERRVSAHKVFLIASSSVFREMFNPSTPGTSEVIIDDPYIDADDFETFIENLSTGRVEIGVHNVAKQSYLAHKYKVTSVKDFCAQFLSERIKLIGFFHVLKIADSCGMDDVRKACIETLICQFGGEDEDLELFSELPFEHFIAVMDELLSFGDDLDSEDVKVHHILKGFRAWLMKGYNGVASSKESLQPLGFGCKRKLDD